MTRKDVISEVRSVLLISANRERFPEPVFPIGAAYVAHALQELGIRVRIFDMGLHRRPEGGLLREIAEFQPDLIGLSLRNVDNVSYPVSLFYVPQYADLMGTLRSHTQAPVIAGGSAFALFPEELMELLGPDAGFVGDGEEGIRAYLSAPAGAVLSGHLEDLSGVALPRNIEEIFPGFRRYRTIGVQSSRGCVHRCSYCTYPLLEGSRVRPRPPEAVADELEYLARRHGKKTFFMVDASFNSDESHMAEVLEALAGRDLGIRFSCYLQPRMADLSLFGLLARAGCVSAEFGTDTASPAMLRAMRKSFTLDDVVKTTEACRNAGIDVAHSLLFGGPGESEETIGETVRVMTDLNPKAVLVCVGIRIYPGTEIEQISLAEGVIQDGRSLLDPCFYTGGWEPDALVEAVRSRVSGRGNWFFAGEKDWGESLFLKALGFLYRRGPLWRLLPKRHPKALFGKRSASRE